MPPIQVHNPRNQNPETKLDEDFERFKRNAKALISCMSSYNQALEELQRLATKTCGEYNKYLHSHVSDNRYRNELLLDMKTRVDSKIAMLLQECFTANERPVVDVLDIINGQT